MTLSTQLSSMISGTGSLFYWILAILLILLVGLVIYFYLPGLFKKSTNIAPNLKEKEYHILKELKKLEHDEKMAAENRERLRKEIDHIIEQGKELKRVEEKGRRLNEKEETSRESRGFHGAPAEIKGNKDHEDIRKFLMIVDGLLENIPKKSIDKFAKSGDFELYKRVLEKYGLS